jgi:hypothetical protein
MRILIALAVLVVLGLFVSSERFWKLRRHPLGAVLSTSGWIAVAMGLVLGPHAVALVDRDHVFVLRPLILFCLGWVGVMVGLQLRRDLPKLVPKRALRVAGADFVASMIVPPAIALVTLGFWHDWDNVLGIMVLAGLVGACSVGWSAEVRSLIRRQEPTERGNFLRAAAGVGSLLAVPAYGLVFMVIKHGQLADAPGVTVLELSGLPLVVGLAVSLVIAAVFGLIGAWLMRIAGRSESQFLVVLLGLVSFATGAAATMGFSPLFVAMLCGVVAANVPGDVLTRFKRVIVEAEQPIAMAMMLTAGVLADPNLPGGAWLLLGLLLVGRVLVKLPFGRWGLPAARPEAGPSSALVMGPLRQAPLAIAMAMGYAISGHEPLTADLLGGGQLLMIVILLGLITDAAPLSRRMLGRSRLESPAEAQPGASAT